MLPQRAVRRTQEELVQHLVVGEDDVRDRRADGVPVLDESLRGHDRARCSRVLARVKRSRHAIQRRVLVEHSRQAAGLVIGQGVHGVQDDRLDPVYALFPGSDCVIQQRVQERFGLTRSRSRGHDGGFRKPQSLAILRPFHGGVRGEAAECLGLVGVGLEPVRQHAQRGGPGLGVERQACPQERPSEDALILVAQKVSKRVPRIAVRELDGRGDVFHQGRLHGLGLQRGKQLTHAPLTPS